MSNESNLGSIFVAAASFAGGVALGIVLTRRINGENPQWISNQTHRLSDWIDRRGEFLLEKGDQGIRTLRGNLRREIDRNVPDPYKATENMVLEESDILGI